ncbi:hypothetical protein ANCCAN_10547 [Ancylostoma caninum]|uniref:Uncharacterized protein n=1 Tax=Ancylostoma caninum TaxID=29170 RepID=A0A368GKG0_ANCCA|nr:hypothetical protein ANCCAN_10547 [Ancylostoma caninum]
MSDDGPPKLAPNAAMVAQESRQIQQSRPANGSAGLRNLAPRQQCSAPDVMRMVGTIPQGMLPLTRKQKYKSISPQS